LVVHTRAYILGGHGEPMPVGAVGELCIGGTGLARGYLNRAELTAERFVPDPFTAEAGARIYKKGTWPAGKPDGNIDFVGRNDFQVKIRGFRVELGEIEAQLGKHAGVREAVVVDREDTTGDKRLVAYYTSREKQPGEALVAAEDLRAHLTAGLPQHMVPAAYVRLDRMPLTASGEVDRKNLPAPEGDVYAVRGYEAPVGEIETKLAAIWPELLKVERVGRYDDFFALGGHSLMAIRIVARVRDAFHTDISLRQLFDTPTIASFSIAIERRLQDETDGPSQSQAQPTIKRVAREAVFVSDED
jgi:acyl carrier protein